MGRTVVHTTPECMVCGAASEIELDEDRLRAWQSGMFIQDAFPDLSADERELIKMGTHSACWDIAMGPEE